MHATRRLLCVRTYYVVGMPLPQLLTLLESTVSLLSTRSLSRERGLLSL
jgi:hypothetical protein